MRKTTMKMQNKKKSLSLFLCSVLIVAMALFTTGCGDNAKTSTTSSQNTEVAPSKDGTETFFEIHTDKQIVGEALQELELIAGEDGQYGLYVKTVNGITADYDKDGAYWAFYVNGEYAQSGVDTTKITEGESYSFKVEKS